MQNIFYKPALQTLCRITQCGLNVKRVSRRTRKRKEELRGKGRKRKPIKGVKSGPYCFLESPATVENFDINQIHCPTKGPNIMNIKENRINIEKLAVMEFETFSETESFLVSRYTNE